LSKEHLINKTKYEARTASGYIQPDGRAL